MTLQAIETSYKGYKFRSRLEARWAVFFENLGVLWDYETEGYILPSGKRYLPDFYVRATNGAPGWFVEVKGNLDDEVGVKKARELDNIPPPNTLGCLIVSSLKYAEIDPGSFDYPPTRNNMALFCQCIGNFSLTKINKAVTAARRARFEFGEEG